MKVGRSTGNSPSISATHRYGVLLGLILVSLAFQVATPDVAWSRLAVVCLQGGTLLLALWASESRPLLIRGAVVGVGVALVATAGVVIGVGDFGPLPARVMTLLLVSLAPVAIISGVVREVRERRMVTLHSMFGVLCVYLLIGMLFAVSFGVVDQLSTTAFFTSMATPTESDFLYFSFATITTTGYGDLTAATDVGRSLAIAEALTGQIYLVTVVALIVSNLGRTRTA